MPSSPSLPDAWLRGVAANPAAPADALVRLLDPAARSVWPALCEGRDLPEDVVDAVVTHPDRAVRRAFARNPHVDPAQRGRLVRDPSGLVRADLAGGPRPRLRKVPPLPDAVLEALLTAEEAGEDAKVTAAEVAGELLSSGQIPLSFWRTLHEHPRPELRRMGVSDMWHGLGPAERAAVLADPDAAVRAAAAARTRELDPVAMEADLPERDCHGRTHLLVNLPVTDAVAEACLAAGRDLRSLAQNPHTPFHTVVRLARDPDPRVRERVAARADVDAALLAELAEDPDESVRTRAVLHPLPRTWVERDAIDWLGGAEDDGPIGEVPGEPATSWFAECAVSAHVILRRVAASYAALPAELVGRLAVDPDPEVRHRLACRHPLAPPEAVLDTFVERPEQRRHLLTLPRLPRTGLQHLLGHDDPEVRAFAAADPTLEQAPVQLLADPDERVRRATAAAPALRDEDTLAALLDDPATAEGAAANPNLPAARLHELLDLAGLPRPARSLPAQHLPARSLPSRP
ncbi:MULTISPECIES: HEAT repeat domain-containing protein [unclassified Streptomyces]|uniref:HEAT repeat domain-containing protein n=1 Tax=unclassified Streptomyces TaxID=2593676 RepID=UPI0019D1F6CC|nr:MULTISPECIES: HEAT repeat domain-containing protein [unclassified Streptomyces]